MLLLGQTQQKARATFRVARQRDLVAGLLWCKEIPCWAAVLFFLPFLRLLVVSMDMIPSECCFGHVNKLLERSVNVKQADAVQTGDTWRFGTDCRDW
jgi:hypothetical protein